MGKADSEKVLRISALKFCFLNESPWMSQVSKTYAENQAVRRALHSRRRLRYNRIPSSKLIFAPPA